MKNMLSVLLENQPGALSRVIGLFSQRGYNIESLNVSTTDDPTLSRLTLTTHVPDLAVEEQIEKQLHKLVDVLKVSNVANTSYVERELMLVKVKALNEKREELKRLADIFRGQIIDLTASLYTIQLVGESSKIDAFLETLKETTEIIEIVRSGAIGLSRGEKAMRSS